MPPKRKPITAPMQVDPMLPTAAIPPPPTRPKDVTKSIWSRVQSLWPYLVAAVGAVSGLALLANLHEQGALNSEQGLDTIVQVSQQAAHAGVTGRSRPGGLGQGAWRRELGKSSAGAALLASERPAPAPAPAGVGLSARLLNSSPGL